jgi:hypothetical protein
MLRTIYDATLTPRGARRGAQVCEEAPGQLEAEVPLGAKADDNRCYGLYMTRP